MSPLERFESWMQRLMEGGLTGLLGGHVQPIDLARRLADHLDGHRLFGAERTYAPNNYRVYLSPTTMGSFATFQTALQDELAAYLVALASENDYHLVGQVKVVLLTDASLKGDQLRLESDLVDPSAAGGQDAHTQAMPVRAKVSDEAVEPLDLVAGARRFPVRGPGPVTVGRALDNDVILDEPSVSRHHARLVVRGRHWMVEDLSSTTGCYVNSKHVSAGLLRSGDLVRFGNVMVRMERPSQGASA